MANAILDGSDAVMLSGESANGLYPVQAVTMLHKLAEETEKVYPYMRVRVVGARAAYDVASDGDERRQVRTE